MKAVLACAAAQPGQHGAVRRGAERHLWGEGCEDVEPFGAHCAPRQALPSALTGVHHTVRSQPMPAFCHHPPKALDT